MKKKNYLKLILIAFLGLSITNCSVEDGVNGADGVDGIDGANGADGADGVNGIDGADGADGVGFNGLTKNGSIILTLDGARPDGQAFTNTTEFKFLSVSAVYLSVLNLAEIGETTNAFSIGRFLSAPDDTYQESLVDLQLRVNNPGEETESFFFILNINEFAVISGDNKFFEITDNFESDDAFVTNLDITNYSYDENTQNLIFSFSFNVAENENDTDHELLISVEVDVILFEKIPSSNAALAKK